MEQQETVKIQLQGVEETMLLPLWVRARETQGRQPIIRDPKAVEMVARIEYDFSVFKTSVKNVMGMRTAIAIRTEILDRAVRAFLMRHPDAVVVNLGAGLDTRFHRVDNGRLRWFDIDLPRSMELRRQFLSESERHRFLTSSFLEPGWMEEIQADGSPVLVIAEGLFMYFSEADVKGFLTRLSERLPGAEVLIDSIGPNLVLLMNLQGWTQQLGVSFKWGLGDGRELERWGAGIRFLDQWHQFDYHPERWGPAAYFTHVPALRSWMKIVHVRVGLPMSK